MKVLFKFFVKVYFIFILYKMNFTILGAACLLLVTAVLGIATAAIAIECYRLNENLITEKRNNWIYTISNLVCNILMVLLAFFCMYLGVTNKLPAPEQV
jgi:prolipoprotein diacylglyceryltransferase